MTPGSSCGSASLASVESARGNSTRGDSAGGPGPGPGDALPVTVSAYVVLTLLGMLEGLVGTFHYSNGPGILVAILFALAILVTCMLGAHGMRTALGGLLPAIGWYAVSLLLSTGTSGGSVIIADTSQGKWFLFGGALCAAAGAVYGYVQWSRPGRERRERLASGPGRSVGAGRSASLGVSSNRAGASPRSAGGQGAGGRGAGAQGGARGSAGPQADGRQSAGGQGSGGRQGRSTQDAGGQSAGGQGAGGQGEGAGGEGATAPASQPRPESGARGAWRAARRSPR